MRREGKEARMQAVYSDGPPPGAPSRQVQLPQPQAALTPGCAYDAVDGGLLIDRRAHHYQHLTHESR